MWEIVDNSLFDLSTTKPDNILIYCVNADGEPHFLSALLYSNQTFSEPSLASYDFSQTSLPSDFDGSVDGTLNLPFSPNYLYEGIRAGNKVELLAAFADPSNYVGSKTPYKIATSGASRTRRTFVLTSIAAAIVSAAAFMW